MSISVSSVDVLESSYNRASGGWLDNYVAVVRPARRSICGDFLNLFVRSFPTVVNYWQGVCCVTMYGPKKTAVVLAENVSGDTLTHPAPTPGSGSGFLYESVHDMMDTRFDTRATLAIILKLARVEFCLFLSC